MKREDYDKLLNSEKNNEKRLSRENKYVNRYISANPLEFNKQEVLNHI